MLLTNEITLVTGSMHNIGLAIARGFAREAGVDASVLDLAGTLLSSARAALGEDADHVEAIRLIEQEAGIEIRG